MEVGLAIYVRLQRDRQQMKDREPLCKSVNVIFYQYFATSRYDNVSEAAKIAKMLM